MSISYVYDYLGRSGPNEHRNRGAKVMSRISGESKPPVRRASESLNVRHEYDQQRRTRCEAWCEERAGQPLAPEQRDKPGASFYQQDNPGKQGGDVSGTGASP